MKNSPSPKFDAPKDGGSGPENPENESEQFSDVPEYNFEDGKTEILSEVIKLLKKQDSIVVAFSDSGQNVGKSTLMNELLKDLHNRGIPAVGAHRPDEFSASTVELVKDRSPVQDSERAYEDKLVFIIDQMDMMAYTQGRYEAVKKRYDKKVKDSLQDIDDEVSGIDIWVGLYRPDKPFPQKNSSGESVKPLADIMIRNEHAEDK